MCEIETSAWRNYALSDCFNIDSGAAPGIFRDDTASIPLMGANGPIGACSASNFGPGYILGRVGAAGSVIRVQERVWASDNTLILVPKSHVEENFAHYLLLFVKPWELATVTAQPLITQSNLSSLPVRLPSEKEQQYIARILDTLDTTIRETEAIIAKLKAVKQGLLHDLLTRGLDDNGELRPPQSEAPHLYKQSPLGWIPKEWGISFIGAEFEIQLGKMLDSRKNTGALKPYLGNKAVQWDYIDIAESQLVPLSISDLSRFRLQHGDLLVCEGGDVGRSAIWENQLPECYYQKALHRLRPLNGYSARLLLELLQWWISRDYLVDYITKTSIAHLTQEKLADIPLPIPSVVEQNLIVNQLTSHRERLSNEKEKLNKLKKLKSGLMDDLLTGRVRVTPLLNDPPDTSPEAIP